MSGENPFGPMPPYSPYARPPVSASEENMWAMFCHLSGLVLGWLGPLLVWLIQREKMPFVDDQGKEALNFQISIIIYSIVCFPFCFILIGFAMLIGVMLFAFVAPIMAALEANRGICHRYPMCIRLIT